MHGDYAGDDCCPHIHWCWNHAAAENKEAKGVSAKRDSGIRVGGLHIFLDNLPAAMRDLCWATSRMGNCRWKGIIYLGLLWGAISLVVVSVFYQSAFLYYNFQGSEGSKFVVYLFIYCF